MFHLPNLTGIGIAGIQGMEIRFKSAVLSDDHMFGY